MKRAVLLTKLSGQFVHDMGGIEEAQRLVPYPPAPNWFVRGPRGGVYLAVGERERDWSDQFEDDWMRGQWSVIDRSQGVRYIRPRTKAHREAQEVLR